MQTEWKLTETERERYRLFLEVEGEENKERGGWMTCKKI
jgi:hypothetical protein